MLQTRFTELVGCSVPIQQAGLGTMSPPELVAAVSGAGGLGMLGTARAGGGSLAALGTLLEQVQSLTARPFGVNFLMAPEFLEDTDPGCFALAARAARLVDCFYGWPDPAIVETVHREGALVSWQVGSRAEAIAAEAAGCDIVIAQGIEAGGHVRGRIGLLALLEQVLDAVGVPVLAAGGVGSGRALAAVLAAGAAGARVGTRFAAAVEANAHPQYVEALIAANADDTVYSTTFTSWWAVPGRVLRSSVDAAIAFGGTIVAETVSLDGSPVSIGRFEPGVADRDTTGAIEAMSLWAGESVGNVTRIQPAADIVHELAGDAERLLRRWDSTPKRA